MRCIDYESQLHYKTRCVNIINRKLSSGDSSGKPRLQLFRLPRSNFEYVGSVYRGSLLLKHCLTLVSGSPPLKIAKAATAKSVTIQTNCAACNEIYEKRYTGPCRLYSLVSLYFVSYQVSSLVIDHCIYLKRASFPFSLQ